MSGNYQHALYDKKLVSAELCLVVNPSSVPPTDEGWLRKEANDTVQRAIIGEGRVAECRIGTTHSLVTVDNSEGIDVFNSRNSRITSTFKETSSITIAGDKLPTRVQISHICQNISRTLNVTFQEDIRSVTVSGYWGHVQQARESIHSLILDNEETTAGKGFGIGGGDTSYRKGNEVYYHATPTSTSFPIATPTSTAFPNVTHTSTTFPNVTSTSTSFPIDSHTQPSYSKDLPSGTSHYDTMSNVSPDIIKFMKNNRMGFRSGIDHKEGSTTVHFTFNSKDALDAAMEEFQNIYDELEQAGVKKGCVTVPKGVHQDTGMALIASELETKYPHTLLTWLPGNLEMEIISSELENVTTDLQEMMENLRIQENKQGAGRGGGGGRGGRGGGGGGGRGWGESFGKWFGQKNKPPSTIHAEYRPEVTMSFRNGRRFVLRHGNILDETVDAVVNPGNEFLSHGAGLAKQIDKASGGKIAEYSQRILTRNGGRIPTGTVVSTGSGGQLKCSKVIHAVGPNANELPSDQMCEELLRKTIGNVLQEGSDLSIKSLAIPAISSGLFGMDKETVAEIIVSMLVDYQNKNPPHGFLKDLRVVIWDKETYYPFLNFTSSIKASLND